MVSLANWLYSNRKSLVNDYSITYAVGVGSRARIVDTRQYYK